MLTFILANVFEGKGKSGIFALYYPYLAKSTFADDTQKAKMVQAH